MATIKVVSLCDWLQYFILKPTSRRTKFLYLFLQQKDSSTFLYSNHSLKDLGFTNNIKTSISYITFYNQTYADIFLSRCKDLNKVPSYIDISKLLPIAKELASTNEEFQFVYNQNKLCIKHGRFCTPIGVQINDPISLLQLNSIVKKIEYIQSNKNQCLVSYIDPVKSYEFITIQHPDLIDQQVVLPIINGLDAVSKEIVKFDWGEDFPKTQPIKVYLWSESKTDLINKKYNVIKYITEFTTNDFNIFTYRPYFTLLNLKESV
jgi:hypothetical protein